MVDKTLLNPNSSRNQTLIKKENNYFSSYSKDANKQKYLHQSSLSAVEHTDKRSYVNFHVLWNSFHSAAAYCQEMEQSSNAEKTVVYIFQVSNGNVTEVISLIVRNYLYITYQNRWPG
ncbi:hypothetical protein TNCT_319761 [Trichonephila clavata]|uniref:Uncharacterized protein n=1 Tax=Trichonephila clavata TaxID=2740835 RepID=A0A8X6JL25_TRICU|nr:hypothetical protein TNCT_319761 [Trichonephila clavata]